VIRVQLDVAAVAGAVAAAASLDLVRGLCQLRQ
jgi:hypothetical protein